MESSPTRLISDPSPAALTAEMLAKGVAFLSASDPDLARIHQQRGLPPMWAREPGFATLVHIILEQQVSLASARAAFEKLKLAIPDVTPQAFLGLSAVELKRIGFSQQKAGYCRGLALLIEQRALDLEQLAGLEDEAVRAALVQVKGIGVWTANIYLLMVLLRPDIWPAGDLALIHALQKVKRLPARPGPEELEQITRPWRPWRSVAARLLWHEYLSA